MVIIEKLQTIFLKLKELMMPKVQLDWVRKDPEILLVENLCPVLVR